MNFKSFKFLVVFLVILVLARSQVTTNSTDDREGKNRIANCWSADECAENMECSFGNCQCNPPHIYITEKDKCLPQSGYREHCEYSAQCAASDYNTVCAAGYCLCHSGYERKNYRCVLREPSSQINKDIYKAAIVALSCFVITVIGLFVLFLCNRSYLRRASRDESVPDFSSTSPRRPSDIFNVSEELAAMRRIDKPPNYQDILVQDRMIRGMPPPAYSDIVDASTSTAGLPINTQPMELVRGTLRTGSPAAYATPQPTQVSAVMRLMRQSTTSSAPSTDTISGSVALPTTRVGADNNAFDNRE